MRKNLRKKGNLKELSPPVGTLITFLFLTLLIFSSHFSAYAHEWNSTDTHQHDFCSWSEPKPTFLPQPLIGLDGTIYTFMSYFDNNTGTNAYAICAIDPNNFDNNSCKWTMNLQYPPSSAYIGNNGDLYLIAYKTYYEMDLALSDNLTIYLNAINPDNQTQKWSKILDYNRASLLSPLIQLGTELYGNFYNIDTTYYRSIEDLPEESLYFNIAINAAIGPKGNIYVGSESGSVYAIDPNTGEETTIFDSSDNVTVVRAINNTGKLYVISYGISCEDGKFTPLCHIDNSSLYAINLDNDSVAWKINSEEGYAFADLSLGNGMAYIIELPIQQMLVEFAKRDLPYYGPMKIIAVNSLNGDYISQYDDGVDFAYLVDPVVVGENNEAYVYGSINGKESCIYKINPIDNSAICILNLQSENEDYRFLGEVNSISMDQSGNLIVTGMFTYLSDGEINRYNLIILSDNGSILYQNPVGFSNPSEDSAEIYIPAISKEGHVYFMGVSSIDESTHIWSIDTNLTGTPSSPWPRLGHDNRNTNCAMDYLGDPTSNNPEKPVYFSISTGKIKEINIMNFQEMSDNETFTTPHPVTLSPVKVVNITIDNVSDNVTVTIYNIDAPDNAAFYKYVNGEWINLKDPKVCEDCNFNYNRNSDGTYNISFRIKDNGDLDSSKVKGVIEDPIVIGSETETSSETSSSGGGGCTTSNSASVGLILILLAGLGLFLFKGKDSTTRH